VKLDLVPRFTSDEVLFRALVEEEAGASSPTNANLLASRGSAAFFAAYFSTTTRGLFPSQRLYLNHLLLLRIDLQ